jgi:hypothetical protein
MVWAMELPTIASFLNGPLLWALLLLYLVYAIYFVRKVLVAEVRVLPKWLWVVVVLFISPPLSGIVFLTSGVKE